MAMYGTDQCVQTCLSDHFEIIVNEGHQLASLDSIRVDFWKLCPCAFESGGAMMRNAFCLAFPSFLTRWPCIKQDLVLPTTCRRPS